MASFLKLRKAASLPGVLEANTAYFINNASTGVLEIYVTDKLGTVAFHSRNDVDIANVTNAIIASLRNQPNGLAALDASGNVIGAVTASIDGQNSSLQSNSAYIWDDLGESFVVKATSGSGNPSFGSVGRGNLQGLLFASGTMNQVWIDFHINHKYALGTKVYPHIHWMPLTTHTGTVRWGIEYSVAKGFDQQAFGAPTTVYVNHVVSVSSQYKHLISEVSDADAIPATNLEPDTFVKCRIFRDGSNALDTFAANVHAWRCDLHYQVARIGTRRKAPNFFT